MKPHTIEQREFVMQKTYIKAQLKGVEPRSRFCEDCEWANRWYERCNFFGERLKGVWAHGNGHRFTFERLEQCLRAEKGVGASRAKK